MRFLVPLVKTRDFGMTPERLVKQRGELRDAISEQKLTGRVRQRDEENVSVYFASRGLHFSFSCLGENKISKRGYGEK
jgi:hypothetical protein